MRRDLGHAALVSVALHSALLFPGWRGQAASVDVQRGPVSFEVELFSEAQIPTSQKPAPAPLSNAQGESWMQDQARSASSPPPSLEAVSGHGAFSDAKPNGTMNPPPSYPWFARIRGWEGTVVLRVRVEADGHPSAVRVVESAGYPVLDQAAQQAIQQWNFLPARHGGQAMSSEVELPMRFRLTSSTADRP